jgi:uncharacterized membrane protein
MILLMFIVVAVAGLEHVMPLVTRGDIFFGVTTPEEFRDTAEGRRIVRLYRWQVWLICVAAVLLLVFAGRPDYTQVLPFVLLLQVAAGFGAFFVTYRAARRHAVAPSSVRVAALQPPQGSRILWPLLFLGLLVLVVSQAVYLSQHWDRIPDPFPVHWNLSGHADRFVPRSARTVYGELAVGGGLGAFFLAVGYLLSRKMRRIAVAGSPAKSEERFRRVIAGFLALVAYGTAIMVSPVFVAQGLVNVELMTGVLLAAAALMIAFAVLAGQGGSRMRRAPAGLTATTVAAPTGDRTPDACWRLGVFYYNPEDSALIVEKRFGIGYTLNFANPQAWLLGGLLGIVIASMFIFIR